MPRGGRERCLRFFASLFRPVIHGLQVHPPLGLVSGRHANRFVGVEEGVGCCRFNVIDKLDVVLDVAFSGAVSATGIGMRAYKPLLLELAFIDRAVQLGVRIEVSPPVILVFPSRALRSRRRRKRGWRRTVAFRQLHNRNGLASLEPASLACRRAAAA